MRGVFLGAVLIGLLVGGVVVGVRALNGGSASPAAQATAPPRTPQATPDAFAKAWTVGNRQALYQLLDPDTQRATSLSSFSDAYDSFETETTETGLQATTVNAAPGSATLAVKLDTAYFGSLEYTITLNLS